MLAILLIEMKWSKESRTPNGALQRQKFYKPVRIEDGVNLSGDGIFVKKCHYYQCGNTITSDVEVSDNLDRRLYEMGKGKAFTESDEREQRMAVLRAKSVQKDKGSFCKIEDHDIPCVMVNEEANNCYRIKWSDSEYAMPRRRGGNEDFYHKGTKLAGQPNRLNETAFILEEGKAGLLKYNYRYSSYHGQWYKCYYVYVVNEKILTQDIFMREYDYEYNQLADLF